MGGSAPKAPDYAAQAEKQGEANIEASRVSSRLSNPNVITPYGTQTITYGDTPFDQVGYDSAMAGYQERLQLPAAAPVRADYNQDYTTDTFDQTGFDKAQNEYNTLKARYDRIGPTTTIRGDQYPSDRGAAPVAPSRDAYGTNETTQGFNETGYNTALNRFNAGQPELAPDRANFMGAADGGGNQDIPTVRQSLTPASQSLYDQELRVNAALGNTAEKGLSTIDQMLGTPFDISQVRDKAQFQDQTLGQRPQYDPTQLRDKEQFANADMRGKAEFDPSQLRNKAQFDDSNIRDQAQSGQQAWNNAYNAQMQRNQPFEDRRRDRLTNQLSNQGIFAGSEAFGESMRDLERGENDFRLGAQQNATAQQQAQFGMDMQGRQQDQQEAQQAFARGTQGRGIDFEEQQNRYGMDIQNRQLDQQEAQQQYGRNVQGRLADLGEQQAGFGMGMQDRQNAFAEQQARFGMDTQARQDDLSQEAYLRQLSLNELNALRMGNQIQNPQFQGFQGQSVAPAPIMQGANAQYNAALDKSNASNAATGNLVSAGTSLAGAGMMTAGMFAM
jgi:hypothetical protein